MIAERVFISTRYSVGKHTEVSVDEARFVLRQTYIHAQLHFTKMIVYVTPAITASTPANIVI